MKTLITLSILLLLTACSSLERKSLGLQATPVVWYSAETKQCTNVTIEGEIVPGGCNQLAQLAPYTYQFE